MLGLVLNESEIVKNTLEGSIDLPSKPFKVIRMIIKKMIIDNNTEEEIIKNMNEFLSDKYGENYNKVYWNKTIKSTITSLKKNEINKMIDIDKIEIYKEELEKIESLKDIKLEKLAFTILVYTKINNIINPCINNRINIPLTNLIKESFIKRDEESKILLNKLYRLEYIKQNNSCDSSSIQNRYIEDSGEVAIEINDLRDYQPITWYLEYKGLSKYKKCECCLKRIEINIKSKKPTLMCKACAYDKKKKEIAKFNRIRRGKNDNLQDNK